MKSFHLLKNLILIVVISFCLSNILNTYIALTLFTNKKLSTAGRSSFLSATSAENFSFTELKKSISSRNVFNSNGEIPYEDTLDPSKEITINFANIPCSYDVKVPFELLGIIYTGMSKTNLVTFKDPSIDIADVYREGQPILGVEGYEVYKITGSSSVQLRHDKKKICLSILSKSIFKKNTPNKVVGNEVESYELSSDFVSQEIGTGFSKILNSARMIPESLSGKTIGFKVFDIMPGTLFKRINLEDGDLITKVNGENIDDPSQGFKLYEVFQNESNITLQISRSGTQITKKVTVR